SARSTGTKTRTARTRALSRPRSRPTTRTTPPSWAGPQSLRCQGPPTGRTRMPRLRDVPPCRVARAGHSKGDAAMMLRPRQALLVERSLAALAQHGNTLSVGPTGSGKTIMLSAVAGSLLAEPDAKACILAHRDELTGQNREKFGRVNPGLTT